MWILKEQNCPAYRLLYKSLNETWHSCSKSNMHGAIK